MYKVKRQSLVRFMCPFSLDIGNDLPVALTVSTSSSEGLAASFRNNKAQVIFLSSQDL